MIIFGVNDSSHDAAVSVVVDGRIVFAAHSERYSKVKQDWSIHRDLWAEALSFGRPDVIAYFENRFRKRLRRRVSGGLNGDYSRLYRRHFLPVVPEVQYDHHHSHAAAGYYTSPFRDACVVVIDAVGEFETMSIWRGAEHKLSRVFSTRLPFSFGLFYSAFTAAIGLRPVIDEYITMGMSAFGDRSRFYGSVAEMFPAWNQQTRSFLRFSGLPRPKTDRDRFDLAAAVQAVYEDRFSDLLHKARDYVDSPNLVLMGGCALNCVANPIAFETFDDVWIMPNPGDAGSSLGAALAAWGDHVPWTGPYLGHLIPGEYPVDQAADELERNGLVAVAVGRAEFGPRALGNRSLFADPRSIDAKTRVNQVKRREQFRPFAPVVLAERAHEWFELPALSPYMQYAVKCRRPEAVPAVVHVDGTSRVQTVSVSEHPGLHALLTEWDKRTGVPVLLNTSLNIRDEPMVNTVSDALNWQAMYGVKVLPAKQFG